MEPGRWVWIKKSCNNGNVQMSIDHSLYAYVLSMSQGTMVIQPLIAMDQTVDSKYIFMPRTLYCSVWYCGIVQTGVIFYGSLHARIQSYRSDQIALFICKWSGVHKPSVATLSVIIFASAQINKHVMHNAM